MSFEVNLVRYDTYCESNETLATAYAESLEGLLVVIRTFTESPEWKNDVGLEIFEIERPHGPERR